MKLVSRKPLTATIIGVLFVGDRFGVPDPLRAVLLLGAVLLLAPKPRQA